MNTLTVLPDGYITIEFPDGGAACSCGVTRGPLPDLHHACTPPDAGDWGRWARGRGEDSEDVPWTCPETDPATGERCGLIWDWERDVCGECGRPEDPTWRRRAIRPHTGGSPFPWISVARGGISFGFDTTPFAEHQHAEPRPAEDERSVPYHPDGSSIRASGGWCAPAEQVYGGGSL